MTFLEQWVQLVVLVVTAVVIVIPAVYLAARAGAFAWFRTKREHFNNVLDDLKEGD